MSVVLAASPARAQQAPTTSPAAASDSDGQAGHKATATGSPSGLQDIIVTARRVSENLQNVPVSITAFSGQALIAQGARTTADIKTLTPNLSIRAGGPNTSTLNITIRGQVQSDVIGTLDPSVGVYVDEVYFARAAGVDAGLLDLERVEVLKGPQGTLFGRNTTGGALNITTNKPNMKKLGGSARVTIGNYGELDGEAIINLPIVEDKLALRLAGQRQHTTGYGRELTTGKHLNETNNYLIRGKLRWTPNERIDVTLSGEHFHVNQSPATQKPNYVSPNFALPGSTAAFPLIVPSTPEIIAALSTGGCFDFTTFSCPGSYRPGSATFASYIDRGGFYDSTYSLFQKSTVNTTTASINATYELSDSVKIKYIGAYRRVSARTPFDLDGSPFVIIDATLSKHGYSWSHELQLAGKLFDNRLDYTVGLYRFTESGVELSSTLAVPLLNPFNPSQFIGTYGSRASAVYGQATYRLTDTLSATGGIRYSIDKKSLDSRNMAGTVCSVPVSLRNNPDVPCSVLFDRTDKAVSYTASVNYKPSRALLLYVKTSRGFRGGGFNLRGGDLLSYTPFKPEKVTDYEVGVKSEFFDRRARLNIAAFTSDYSNIQRSTQVPNGSGSVSSIISNAAKARIKGLEAELSIVPVTGLTLSGGLGITDPRYKSFLATCVIPGGPTSGTPCDRSGEPFDNVAKTTWNVSGQYILPVGEGNVMLHGDYSHTSKVSTQSISYTQTPTLTSFVTQPGFGTFNARIAWSMRSNGDGLGVAVFARNIANKKYNVYFLDFVNGGLGYDLRQPGEPRRYGAELSFKF
jgi:iron complex outermembrane receptor protein